MSFSKLKKSDLLEAAERFAVEVDASSNKETLVTDLVESGVTWAMYCKEFNVVEEVKAKSAKGEYVVDGSRDVLVKMERNHPVYEVRGYRFTREHPYVLVNEEDVDYLIEIEGGFKQATPRELEAYYG